MKDSSDNSTVDFLKYKNNQLSKCLLLEIRETYKLSQNLAANLLGLHAMTISKIERGKAKHNNEIYYKLLILREISTIPGAIEAVKYINIMASGYAAMSVAWTLKKSMEV